MTVGMCDRDLQEDFIQRPRRLEPVPRPKPPASWRPPRHGPPPDPLSQLAMCSYTDTGWRMGSRCRSRYELGEHPTGEHGSRPSAVCRATCPCPPHAAALQLPLLSLTAAASTSKRWLHTEHQPEHVLSVLRTNTVCYCG